MRTVRAVLGGQPAPAGRGTDRVDEPAQRRAVPVDPGPQHTVAEATAARQGQLQRRVAPRHPGEVFDEPVPGALVDLTQERQGRGSYPTGVLLVALPVTVRRSLPRVSGISATVTTETTASPIAYQVNADGVPISAK